MALCLYLAGPFSRLIDYKCGAMEKETLLISLILLSSFHDSANGHEKNDELPVYYWCTPERVEIDYSYLKTGEWLGNPDVIKKNLAVHTQGGAVSKNAWTLMNCYQSTAMEFSSRR